MKILNKLGHQELSKDRTTKYGVRHTKALAHHPKSKGIVAIKHRALWAIKKLNFDFQAMGERWLLQLNELEEIRNNSYENAQIYKDKTNNLHDKQLIRKELKEGDIVLFFNSRLRLFLGKLTF